MSVTVTVRRWKPMAERQIEDRMFREDNREKERIPCMATVEYLRKWRKDHPGYSAQKAREWRARQMAKDPNFFKDKHRKFSESHPGYFREYQRKWREANFDSYYAHMEKSNELSSKKRKAASAVRRQTSRAFALSGNLRSRNVAMDNEVARHMAKGRDVGTIAVFMEIPVSIVQQAINRVQRRKAVPTVDKTSGAA